MADLVQKSADNGKIKQGMAYTLVYICQIVDVCEMTEFAPSKGLEFSSISEFVHHVGHQKDEKVCNVL